MGKLQQQLTYQRLLQALERELLALDMDPQGNMTSGLGVDKDGVEKTVYDLIIGNVGIEECICENVLEKP